LAGYDQRLRKIQVYKRELEFHETGSGLAGMTLTVPDSTYPLRLEFRALKPAVVPENSAPFRYYAITRMATEGTLAVAGVNYRVLGEATFEHSWGRLPGARGQLLRNRFLLRLSNNTELNLIESQRRDGTGKSIGTGFLVLPEAKMFRFEPDDLSIEPAGYWLSEASGIRYPLSWRIRVPARDIVLDLEPWRNDQEGGGFLADWSGKVSVRGHFGTAGVRGTGHVQLTGYSSPAGR
ncbi:MAG: lipocalin family protein, partial [Gammaproteobacteria bacterium]